MFHFQNFQAIARCSRFQPVSGKFLVGVFSRRFKKWNATIIRTIFFNPHELTKRVLRKFYEILWCQNELFGLAKSTKKVFPVFQRNIDNWARLRGSPFQFLVLWDFFSQFFLQRVPFNFFWCLATKWMLKNPKGYRFGLFRHCETFFPEKNFPKGCPPFNFLMFCNNAC